jgi:ABC-type lipoprotein release transport system permease subunit
MIGASDFAGSNRPFETTMTFLPFILRRATRHWQILLTLSLGVILATALLVSGPLLVDEVIELGLQRTLQSAAPLDGHLRLTAQTTMDQAGYAALDAQINGVFQERLGAHLGQVVRATCSNWTFPWVAGQLVADQRVNLCAYQDIVNHAEVIAGAWPAAPATEPNVIPAVIGEEMAQLYTLRVGDRLPLSFQQQDDQPRAWIEVTGIVWPQNPRDPYWFGEFSPLATQSTQRWAALYSAIVPGESFFPTTTSLFPQKGIALAWQTLLSHNTIRTGDIAPLRAQILGLRADLRALQSRVVLETGVDDILSNFQTQSETIRAPLYILLAEVVLLTLYYVTMVAALSMQQIEREFAILRSRGASGWQLLKIQLTEAGMIAAVAFLSGPVLGAALARGLVWFGPLADISQPGWALNLAQSAWLAAAGGTLACLAGLLLPVGPALRRTIVTHQQMTTRVTRPPWWQRFYLDVFLLFVGLILLWRLRLYGDLVVGGAARPRLDWLLLLSPLALLLGSATILLRIFPLVFKAMAFLAGRARGLAGVLAMWQASRNPTHVARLVLLLTLSIALGILATGLNATLDQSEIERAQYVSGNDIRLLSQRSIPLQDLASTPGVLDLSGTWHGQGTVDLKSGRAFPQFQVLAIEPYSFADVTTYRDDYSDRYMGELLGYLVAEEKQLPPMIPLPDKPSRLGIWLRATTTDQELGSSRRYIDGDSDVDRVGVEAKLQTAQGQLFTVRLQPYATNQTNTQPINQFILGLTIGGQETELHFDITPIADDWRYFDTSLPVFPPSSYPLTLHSLWVQNRATNFNTPVSHIALHLAFDDLTVVDGETREASIVESFEDPTRIWYFDDPGLTARFTKNEPHNGQAVLAADLNFSRRFQTTSLKLTQGRKKESLPALVSPAFLKTTELNVGDAVHAWVNSIDIDFEIVGIAQYFPTLYEELEAGFLITARDLLLPLLNDTSRASVNLNQVFLETDGDTSLATLTALVPNLSQSWKAESVRKTIKANPLALGLRGVTFFGYTLTTLLSLVGFATHFYLSARQREVLYGVMRAMGLSPRQLYGSMVLEQVILILAGLALGTGLGILLNQITLPRLPIALGGQSPIPPFYPRDDWIAVGRIYLILASAFLISLGVATALLWRARIHRILRIGQE